ncbi:MAG: 4'-phosphopantetheinyl transferase superfamily protein [Cyclobacteriaceae bacterium]|nr:4'-phosphopantetheinyl transferase superfamily protein [Cyclobacteriaceae bacterium]
MPQLETDITKTRAWGLWKIEESQEELNRLSGGGEIIPAEITHPEKRCEFLAARKLMRNLVEHLNLSYQGLTKDVYGKPLLHGYPHHISLSHSYPYVTAIIDTEKPVGIDLEHFKSKLLRIAPRIFSSLELKDAGNNLIKNSIYWSAKEAMMKVYGKKDLVFSENLLVEPFKLESTGTLTGHIITPEKETTLSLYYKQYRDFVIVYNL